MAEYGNLTVVSTGNGSTLRGFVIGFAIGIFVGIIGTAVYMTSIMYG